ncbi:MAG: poly-gamma-glutamate hydrolase family protein [Anaerolineae bacterium]
MIKPFNSFSEMVLNCEQNLDYRVQVTDLGAKATIICIHGGAIEPLTSELASEIAGAQHNLYDLLGLRVGDNRQLRIPVARFDEVRLFTLLKRSQTAVSIDGVPGTDPVVHLGGGNALFKQLLHDQLTQAGYKVAAPYTPGAAHDPVRFYNAAIAGGVLLELSESLRAEMTAEPLSGRNWQQPSSWQSSFFRFTAAVRSALVTFADQAASDLAQALSKFEATTRQIPRELRSGQHHGNKTSS